MTSPVKTKTPALSAHTFLGLNEDLPEDLSEKLLHRQIKSDSDEVIETLFKAISTLDGAAKLQDSQLEEIAIHLWNWAVTKRVGSTITEEQKAKVHHVACRLLYLCGPENPSENIDRKQILVTHGLIVNNPKLLMIFFNLAVNAVSQEQHQEAVSCIQRCKEMLLRLPKETGYLSLICYNFGVDTYSQGKHEESTFWLSQSYDRGKMNLKYSPGSEMQAKVLRLLATVYLEWDCQKYLEKALHAVCLANKEHMNLSGFYLKIRILVKSRSPDEAVKSGLSELLDCEVPLEMCLRTVKLLMEENRETLAFDFLKRVCQHFESSPELGSALLIHIELLLQWDKELLAKQKI